MPLLNLPPANSEQQIYYAFPKAEKLKSRKIIDHLFKNGQSKSFFPIRIVWDFHPLSESVPVQCGVSVSKKNFSNATDRNRIKRQLRETYRLNKNLLLPVVEEEEIQLAIMVLFVSKEFCDFAEINRQTRRSLKLVAKKIKDSKIKKDAAIIYQNTDTPH